MIIVEGPIAAGKTQLAQKLADELEMQYIPEANMDTIYINPYGYDMRQLDPQLPEAVRSYDIKNFCKDPKHQNAANFQIQMFMLRYKLNKLNLPQLIFYLITFWFQIYAIL